MLKKSSSNIMTDLVKLLLKNGGFYTEEFRNNFSGQGSILKTHKFLLIINCCKKIWREAILGSIG